jgi:plasmid stabilization system protein ParE
LSGYRVVFSRRARGQIADIRDYLSHNAGAEAADRIVGALLDRCVELAVFPDRGTPRDALGKGVRTIPFRRNATIGYVVNGTDVVMIGIAWRGQQPEDAIGS